MVLFGFLGSSHDKVLTNSTPQVDPSMLDPSCLVPPSIPNTLGAEDIDKVIAALTNVPDVSLPDGLLDGARRSRSQERRRRHSSGGAQARPGDRAENYGGEAEYDRMRRGGAMMGSRQNDYSNDGGRAFMGGRGGRGGLTDAGGGGRGGGRDRNRNPVPERFRGGWANGPPSRGGPVARGRNVFPQEERGRRGKPRVNNLFKRFQAQHRDKLGPPEGDLLYDGFEPRRRRGEGREGRESRDRVSRSRSRGRKSRKRSASSSSDSSDSDSDTSDSDAHKKKKKKIKKEKKDKKDKKKKKKKDAGKKKKKKDRGGSSSESEEEKKEEGLDWRVDLLKKMKDIKNLPPEELEAEFKKAMTEKKRKEDEEKCLTMIKERQKMARKVKKEAEKRDKKQAKIEAKKEKEQADEEASYGDGDEGGFYNGFQDALGRMQALQEDDSCPPEIKENPFMSSFAEVPFVPENQEEDNVFADDGTNGVTEVDGEELDPYARAQAEAFKREKNLEGEDVSWPAGAIENMGEGAEGEMTKEQMDAEQEAMERAEAENMDDKTKTVVNTSKMFSKIRNRIKGKPLKIHLKSNRKSTEEQDEGVGLEPYQGNDTPGEVVSGEEQEQFGEYEGGMEEYGVPGDEYDLRQSRGPSTSERASREREEGDEEEERRVARYRERARRRRERSQLEEGEREDGEHSPSPEPERPHHRRRRKRKHERREGGTPTRDEGALEDGEVVEGGRRERRRRHRTPEQYQGPRDIGPPGSFPPSLLGPPPGHAPPPSPYGAPPAPLAVDTSVPPPNMMQGLGVIDKDRAGTFVPGPGYGYGHGANHAPPQARIPPPFQPLGSHQPAPMYAGAPQHTSPTYRGAPPHQQTSPGYNHAPQAPYNRAQSSSPHYSGHAPPSGPPSPRWDAYGPPQGGGRRAPPEVRRSQPLTDVKREQEDTKTFFDSLPTETIDSDQEEEEGEVDITKVSPIMKYMAGKLVEQKYHLEMAGPFSYRSDIPGLSKHLFVAFKMVTLLEGAGYNGSKMYMSAMFPAGLKDTRAELVELVSSGKLHQGIQGSKLTKLCVRCIRCFLAYYTGKSDDIDTSDGECSDSGGEVEGEGGRKGANKTVSTSLMDVLQRVKEEDTQGEEGGPPQPPAPVAGARYSVEDNPWQSMELGMRSEKLRSFTALQSHFTKQLVGRGVDQRDAREQAGDSMMCLVVADFEDAMLRQLVDRWKKVILPEQSQLEVTRSKHEQTLYDQLVNRVLKHQAEFPLSIIQVNTTARLAK